MNPNANQKRLTLAGSPADLSAQIDAVVSKIPAQRRRGCLVLSLLPLYAFFHFGFLLLLLFAGREPDGMAAGVVESVAGMTALNFLASGWFTNFAFPVGFFALVPIIFWLLGWIDKKNGLMIDPGRMGVATVLVNALEGLIEPTAQCVLELDFRHPLDIDFLRDENGDYQRFQQSWLALSGQLPGGQFLKVSVNQECVKSYVEATEESSGGLVLSSSQEYVEIALQPAEGKFSVRATGVSGELSVKSDEGAHLVLATRKVQGFNLALAGQSHSCLTPEAVQGLLTRVVV